jgi:hypothetical protein
LKIGRREQGAGKLPGLVAIAAIVLAGCGGDAPPTPDPVSVSAERDAVIVRLSTSADRLMAGEPIRLRVDVQNAGMDGVSWQSGGCELLDGFEIDGPPLSQPPEGRLWPDAAGLAKWSATAGGVALEDVGNPTIANGVPTICPADLRYEDIQPGDTISADALWSGRSTDGVPAPPGAYRLRFAFPFIGRVAAAQIGPDTPAPRPIDVELPIVLDGQPFDGIPSTLAVDAAFADPRVGAWVDGHLPKERLNGAEIRLVDGRWRFTISVAGDRSTVVFVDPATGTVVDVSLAD